jgi:hypothetical protein
MRTFFALGPWFALIVWPSSAEISSAMFEALQQEAEPKRPPAVARLHMAEKKNGLSANLLTSFREYKGRSRKCGTTMCCGPRWRPATQKLLRSSTTITILGCVGIPVEGGGTLVLNGLVVNHRPVIAGDLPGEPRPDQLVLCWPLVVSHGAILANFEDGTSVAEGPNSGGRIYIPGTGQIVIALRPFPGAVAGEARLRSIRSTNHAMGITWS